MNGSFLTQKIEPGDVDFVLCLAPEVYMLGTPAQQALIQWLAGTETHAQIKNDHSCDSYVFFDTLGGPPDMRLYWLTQFGTDRDGNPKGIAVLSIPGGVR